MTKTFANATTQNALAQEITSAKLSAPEWIALAKELTGISCRSGRDAKNTVHTHYSNNLLLQERIAAVRKSFF